MCGGSRRRKLSNLIDKLKCGGVNLSIRQFVKNEIEQSFVLNSVSDVQGQLEYSVVLKLRTLVKTTPGMVLS